MSSDLQGKVIRADLRGTWSAGYMVAVKKVLQDAGYRLTGSDPQVIIVMGLPGSNVGAARVFRSVGHRILVLSPSGGPDMAEYRDYGFEVSVIPENYLPVSLPQALAELFAQEGSV